MFEAIAKNIATAIFLVCAMIVGSMIPKEPERKENLPIMITIETEETDSPDLIA